MLVFGLFKHQRKLSEKKEKSLRIFSEYKSLSLCKSLQIKKMAFKDLMYNSGILKVLLSLVGPVNLGQ
jgi:hypothetical protein